MKIRSFATLVLVLFVLTLVVSPASASVLTLYDTTAAGGHGFYNGTGGVDGGFTTLVADYGLEGKLMMSLRLAQRYVGPIEPVIENYYACGAGMMCNVDFSVATTGTFHLNDFIYSLTLNDVTTGHSLTFDPTALPDNAYWQGGSKTMTKNLALATGMQNSEYLGFSFISGPLAYTPGDSLLFTLSALPVNPQNPDPAVNIFVNTASMAPVPEPGTYALMSAGLAGIYFLRRRKSA